MTENDIKIGVINAITMAITFTNLEGILKIILLLASIFYTIIKTREVMNSKKNSSDDHSANN